MTLLFRRDRATGLLDLAISQSTSPTILGDLSMAADYQRELVFRAIAVYVPLKNEDICQ
jgi:hypothetical protein